jgi:hypothetical protein
MTVAVDSGNIVSDSSSFTGTATSTSVTIGASDNLLVVAVGIRYNGSPSAPPDSFTYNGASLTLLGNVGAGGNWNTSLWYISAPATGTHTLAGTWSTNTGGGIADVIAIPISGAATSSIFGTAVTGSSTSNNSPAVSPTGGSSGTLYLAATANGIATTAGSGTGQTDISNNNGLGGGANVSVTASTIAGSGTGAFTWTGSGTADSTVWTAVGVNINAAAGGAVVAWIT